MNHTMVSVYRDAYIGDCIGGGLSSQVDSGLFFWNCTRQEAVNYCTEHNIDPTTQFILVKRELCEEDHSFAEPLCKPAQKHQCFGGNFIYTSNGNFYNIGGLKTGSPIPIRDRFEDWN